MPKCLKCSNSVFEVKNLRFTPQVKKRTVEVVVPCNVCKTCETTLMDSEQLNFLRRTASDRYRELEGLLTSKDIVAFREKLGMSQTTFAHFLNVGEASIKRWETYYVQDVSQDDHIRVKCDEAYSQSNYFYLECKYREVDIYSGLKSFSADLVRQVYMYFEKNLPESQNYLHKLHFYSDFLHFKRHSKCITGLRYIPLKSGPSPYNYSLLSQFVSCKKFSHLEKKQPDFDDQEKRTIEDVCEFFLRDNGKSLCELSSQEKGYIETSESDFISYKYAKDLLL